MAYSIEGITQVRARLLALDVGAAGPVAPPDAIEVTWQSTQADRWHQVYVSGALAGVTAMPEDWCLVVVPPVGERGPCGPVLIEVVAVDADDRMTDLGGQLTGFDEASGSRVRLAWQAGPYLDPSLDSFDIFADGRTGRIDYATALNASPIPARPGGVEAWGYGSGGFGSGAYGSGAARYDYTTDPLEPGAWRFAVMALDAAGNRRATAAEVAVQVAPLPRPPANFHIEAYDPATGKATLAWDASPDV